jgi:hypothetical protein
MTSCKILASTFIFDKCNKIRLAKDGFSNTQIESRFTLLTSAAMEMKAQNLFRNIEISDASPPCAGARHY